MGRRRRRAGDPVDLLWLAAADRRRAETDHRRSRHDPRDDVARRGADLGRHRARRHPDGLARRPHRHPPHGDFWRGDDRGRARRIGDWHDLGALYRPRAAGRPVGQRRDVSAAPRLCQPLVRAAARHRLGADRVGSIHRRHDMAEPVRAGDGALRLAGDDDRLRADNHRLDPAARRAVAAPGAEPHASGRSRRRGAPARLDARLAAEPPARPARDRRFLLLRADGAAAKPSRGFLQRPGNPGVAGCADAVGDDRVRLFQPAIMGRAGSPTGSAGC